MPKLRFSDDCCYALLKDAGAKQISREAVREFQEILQEFASSVSERAVLFADDDSRLRVSREDLRNALIEYSKTKTLQGKKTEQTLNGTS